MFKPAKNVGFLGLASPSLLAGLLLLSLVLNVALSVRVRSAAYQLEHSRTLSIGELVPPATLVDLEGRRTRLIYGTGRKTILYYFSSDCPWCRRNSANITALATSTGQEYRFISYMLPPTALSERQHKDYAAPTPILTDDTDGVRSLRLAYRLAGTPQTIVISSDGHVIRNWQGAYTGDLRGEIEGFFGVRLPGLNASESAK